MLSLCISLQCLLLIVTIIKKSEPWLTVLVIIIPFLGTLWYLRLFYFWYWRCRYENAILAENAKM